MWRTCYRLVSSYIVALGLVCGAFGCNQEGGVQQANSEQPVEFPILRSRNGPHSHENRAMQLVIRDAATLSKVPIVDVPVNFDHEMLLIVTLGRVMSDQYAVEIDRVWREKSKLHVSTRVTEPAAGAPPTIATPFCIAVVPRSDLNVDGFLAKPPARDRSWTPSEAPKRW